MQVLVNFKFSSSLLELLQDRWWRLLYQLLLACKVLLVVDYLGHCVLDLEVDVISGGGVLSK